MSLMVNGMPVKELRLRDSLLSAFYYKNPGLHWLPMSLLCNTKKRHSGLKVDEQLVLHTFYSKGHFVVWKFDHVYHVKQ